ncbi:MAG TPA: SUMF1/EgtB/PvdO family nonheme iron enzyme [Fibrobacteria bacterium]|nr:SUMF1/EgtB/PvdO family nonheme iron enzyme [Fibrobacteria bacterium]
MGSIDSLAALDRNGLTRVGFDYDFRMDSAEVTRKDFLSLMGRCPPAPPGSDTQQNLPVTSVSWYDAILYCNRKSRNENRDTVYECLSIRKSSTGSTHSLGGLTYDLKRNGYRLPTEAEWEFAARGPSRGEWVWGENADSAKAAEFAWFSSNSNSQLHGIARKRANGYGLYDLAGNAYEWVNDWLSPLPGGSVRDYAGGLSPNPEMEIPVKGGAYNYGLACLRVSNRSSTYPTIPSTATPRKSLS